MRTSFLSVCLLILSLIIVSCHAVQASYQTSTRSILCVGGAKKHRKPPPPKNRRPTKPPPLASRVPPPTVTSSPPSSSACSTCASFTATSHQAMRGGMVQLPVPNATTCDALAAYMGQVGHTSVNQQPLDWTRLQNKSVTVSFLDALDSEPILAPGLNCGVTCDGRV